MALFAKMDGGLLFTIFSLKQALYDCISEMNCLTPLSLPVKNRIWRFIRTYIALPHMTSPLGSNPPPFPPLDSPLPPPPHT